MAECITVIQILILGYGLGSIPFGVLLAKLFGLPDPRYIGSGNIGATNMLRTGNKKVALLTLALDMGKGVAAVLLTHQLFHVTISSDCVGVGCIHEYTIYHQTYASLALFSAAVGHMYSPWLKFKGGKGVATILGGALALSWPVGMGFVFLWCMVGFTTRYVSLASITALALLPLMTWLRVDAASALIVCMAAAIAIWRHRDNIRRLRQGFEPKVSFKRGVAH